MEHLSGYIDEQVLRRKPGIKQVALYLGLAVLLAAATLVAVHATDSSARSLSPRAGKGGVAPASAGCAVTFTNPGPPALTACVSGHGNVNDIVYSSFGTPVDHVNAEGYCLLNGDTSTTYWDAAQYGEAGWGVATQSSTATTTSVKRTTTDGVFTLTQNIFFKYGSRLVLVGNLVKNNDTVAHTVVFTRSFDGDIEGDPSDDVYDSAGSSVWGKDVDALALTTLGDPSLNAGIGPSKFSDWFSTGSGAGSCFNTFQGTPTAPGDYVGVAQHIATIPAGATVNFRVGYRLL